MTPEQATPGMRVRVMEHHRVEERRGLMGKVVARYGGEEYVAVNVRLADGQYRLFWPRDLEEISSSPAGFLRRASPTRGCCSVSSWQSRCSWGACSSGSWGRCGPQREAGSYGQGGDDWGGGYRKEPRGSELFRGGCSCTASGGGPCLHSPHRRPTHAMASP